MHVIFYILKTVIDDRKDLLSKQISFGDEIHALSIGYEPGSAVEASSILSDLVLTTAL